MIQTAEQLAAELYDLTVPDWDGEINFYRELAREVKGKGQSILEVGCGTGRVAVQLAEDGARVVGMDLDNDMLDVARSKSAGIRWEQGDMRTLDLGETFGLIILPGDGFQFMCTPEDQVKALETFKRHLEPGGVLAIHLDHQSVDWLGDLLGALGGKFEQVKDVIHPDTGRIIRKWNAWRYEQSTQTAIVITQWEEIGKDGAVLQTWERSPMSLHCVFRFEMEHLLARTGFENRVVYGNFFKGELKDDSSDMIWVVTNL
jgi:ubiquinone/menaquinone biosynthesis C-methylase UbiE